MYSEIKNLFIACHRLYTFVKETIATTKNILKNFATEFSDIAAIMYTLKVYVIVVI